MEPPIAIGHSFTVPEDDFGFLNVPKLDATIDKRQEKTPPAVKNRSFLKEMLKGHPVRNGRAHIVSGILLSDDS